VVPADPSVSSIGREQRQEFVMSLASRDRDSDSYQRGEAAPFHGVEALEQRVLLSAVLSGPAVLRVDGTNSADVIAIVANEAAGEVTVVQAPGVAANTVFTGVTELIVRGFNGDDIISLRPSQQLSPQATVFDYRQPDGSPMMITVEGGNGDDRIFGSNNTDFLMGGYGADLIRGFGGADFLNGRQGNDIIEGGPGNDQLFGGPGADRLDGGAGHDMLFGGHGRDIMTGGTGQDYIPAGVGRDQIIDLSEVASPLSQPQNDGPEQPLFVFNNYLNRVTSTG
jgi:hypothetical protein